ncbi:MAG: nitrilase-related carbon-nitrogen hydrolase [Dongiaceae bacterium]
MSRMLSVAATQMACSWDRKQNIRTAAAMVAEAAGQGAQIVLLQELFETPYFCIGKDPAYLKEATSVDDNPAIAAMRGLAERFNVVIPVSFFERAAERTFNSLAMIDAGGALLGVYRKSHIPDFPAYEEAFYFAPGDTGFMVFDTKFARLGAGVCWDQWFPEAARIMVLNGAELLLYPTAIGRPLQASDDDFKNSKPHWQQVMQGHAGANLVPVAASNRVGIEAGGGCRTQFYGGSFLADQFGAKQAEAGEDGPHVVVHCFDLDAIAELRRKWGIFRTRRSDLYGPIVSARAPAYLMDERR